MTAFTIAPIAPGHITGFRSALDSVAREKRYLAFLEAPPADEVDGFIRRNIRAGHAQFVALVGGEVVGWSDIIPIDRPVCAHIGTLGIGIVAGYRSQGIGTALMHAAIDKARSNGLTRIDLTCRASNLGAQALYRKLGFVDEGLRKRGARVDGVYEDVVAMSLLLN
jgi:RimJ/RimL family protein N-acetyltransferase